MAKSKSKKTKFVVLIGIIACLALLFMCFMSNANEKSIQNQGLPNLEQESLVSMNHDNQTECVPNNNNAEALVPNNNNIGKVSISNNNNNAEALVPNNIDNNNSNTEASAKNEEGILEDYEEDCEAQRKSQSKLTYKEEEGSVSHTYHVVGGFNTITIKRSDKQIEMPYDYRGYFGDCQGALGRKAHVQYFYNSSTKVLNIVAFDWDNWNMGNTYEYSSGSTVFEDNIMYDGGTEYCIAKNAETIYLDPKIECIGDRGFRSFCLLKIADILGKLYSLSNLAWHGIGDHCFEDCGLSNPDTGVSMQFLNARKIDGEWYLENTDEWAKHTRVNYFPMDPFSLCGTCSIKKANGTIQHLADVTVKFLDENNKVVSTTKTDLFGQYNTIITSGILRVKVKVEYANSNEGVITSNFMDGMSYHDFNVCFTTKKHIIYGNCSIKFMDCSTQALIRQPVEILDENNDVYIITTTDDDGNYWAELDADCKFKVRVHYPFSSDVITSNPIDMNTDREFNACFRKQYIEINEFSGNCSIKKADGTVQALVNLKVEFVDEYNKTFYTTATDCNGNYKALFKTTEKAKVRVEYANSDEKIITSDLMDMFTNRQFDASFSFESRVLCGHCSVIENCGIKPLSNWTVEFLDENNKVIKTTTTDENGNYETRFESDSIVKVRIYVSYADKSEIISDLMDMHRDHRFDAQFDVRS